MPLTTKQLELFAKIELTLRHVRNLYELGPHDVRAEAVDANQALEEALGKDYAKIFKTKTWKKAMA
jgi:hypothetical protein